MKKLLSMMMALAMVASLALTAFASEEFTVTSTDPTDANLTDSTKTVNSTVKAKVKAPTIKVTIPTQNNVFLNPYKMSVTVGNAAKTDTIVAVPGRIKSESDVKLDFSAVVTGKAASGVTLEKASAEAKKTNSVYMYVYFKNTAAADTAVAAPETPVFNATTDTAADSILVQTTASKSTKVLTLEAAAANSATYGAYLICGDIAKAPDSPWTDKHTVDVTIAFSIAPVQAASANP
jgi:hypothetical protein